MDDLPIKHPKYFVHLLIMKTNRIIINIFLLFIIMGAMVGCKQKYTPKPKSYFRIDFPQKEYISLQGDYPYNFELAKNSVVEKESEEENWINIHYPKYKGTIHISYKKVENNLNEYLEDSRKMVYKHTIKADAIDEKQFINKEQKVYGMLYRIEGNAASSVQFVAHDSSSHFLRGALYFNVHPNQDSLAPVIQYVEKDIVHLMNTLNWK